VPKATCKVYYPPTLNSNHLQYHTTSKYNKSTYSSTCQASATIRIDSHRTGMAADMPPEAGFPADKRVRVVAEHWERSVLAAVLHDKA
jgi:hypothetical protein